MKQNPLTLGSLFDGIGGFPFAGEIAGIKPVWAAEVEPMCVAVTRYRFPDMLHFGDVSKLNGADLPPVDIITFGSPCQDLSVAGLRKGLKHKKNGDGETTRSGLFYDAVRIIYEMREATNGRYPNFLVWENVPGAFTSHSGRDFRAVLEQITQTDIPMPASGRWANAGVVRSERIHAAWRVLDAQYWGVPQRRKRIFLVGSFGTDCAEEILFKRDSVRGYLAPSRETGQKTAADTGKCTAERYTAQSGIIFDARGNGDGNTAPTITGDHNNRVTDYTGVVCTAAGFNDRAPSNARGIGYEAEKSQTLRAGVIPSTVYAIDHTKFAECAKAMLSGQQQAVDFGRTSDRIQINADKAVTLQAGGGGAGAKSGMYLLPMVYAIENGQADNTGLDNVVGALNCMHDQQSVVYAIDRAAFNQSENAKYDFEITKNGVNSTVTARGPSAVCYNICLDKSNAMLSDNPHSGIYETDIIRTLDGNGGNPACNQGGTSVVQFIIDWIVRRLTPRECERLQGYPDDWTVLPKIQDMSEADYLFFRDVFCTDRAINGKPVKKLPTKEQIIKWYNKLDSDSRRYKALGNSLAIPCALRILGGIAEWKEQQDD